jgi:hypothetical protein
MVAAGLVVFYGAIIAVVGFAPPGMLYKVAASVAVAGCYVLAVVLRYLARPANTVVEAVLGFACVPAFFICGVVATIAETGTKVPWLIIAILFVPGIVALFVQAARARQAG